MWTQERKGALSRELLFDPLGSTERRALSVTRLLQLHMGMFMFLCEVSLGDWLQGTGSGAPRRRLTCVSVGRVALEGC